ncbi:MAG: HAMP domain-containing histidine kinase [Proteobacteria bacterium]|nr:HAMP domain-containing histidine kinase [Pseudomonadota bacterium]
MALAAKPVLPNGHDDAAPLEAPLDLDRDAQPAVVIDTEAAEILAANARGRSALGLFPYATFPIALDPAMPAVARLRQIAVSATLGKGAPETLLFWNSGRLKRVKCTVAQRGGKGAKLLLLHIEAVEASDDGFPSPRRAVPAGDAVEKRPDELTSAPVAAKPLAATAAAALDVDTIAKLAHELKTPLTAIAAAAEIMRDERLGEMKNQRYLSYAADIHESAMHALDVITSLLAERAKPATAASRLIAIDLNAIVDRTVSSVKALAESCGLKLSFDTYGSTPHVVANPTALRQILLNLLTNAIKFTPRGGDVRVATGHLEDGRVFLKVQDTGGGMGDVGAAAGSISASELKPAWARSNGIGLPLVESLVRDMGAEIEIDSAPRKGTAATILFGDFARRFE